MHPFTKLLIVSIYVLATTAISGRVGVPTGHHSKNLLRLSRDQKREDEAALSLAEEHADTNGAGVPPLERPKKRKPKKKPRKKPKKTLEDYGLPIIELPVGTVFYSGTPRKLDPLKALWTYMDPRVKYVYAGFTEEDARDWLDKHNHSEVPTEEIDKHLPGVSYAREFKAIRTCSFAIGPHQHKDQLEERYSHFGATVKNSEWYDQNSPWKHVSELEKELLVKMGSEVYETSPLRGPIYKTQKANMRHSLDGFTACVHGAEAAIFLPVQKSPGKGESCIRPVDGDRLLKREEYKELEAKALEIQKNGSLSCYRFEGGTK